MIGLGHGGGRGRSSSVFGDTDIGMLDVSANALAVLILATMLVITVAAPPALRGEVRASERPDLFYPSPLEVVVAPQSTYWIVSGAGITPLDIDPLAAELATGVTTARTPLAQASLIVDRRGYRDLNDHRLSLTLDWEAVRQNATPLDGEAALRAVIEPIQKAFENAGVAPTFVVIAEGTDAFAGLYWGLREAQVPMRWVSIVAQGPLVLKRDVANFEERERRWQ